MVVVVVVGVVWTGEWVRWRKGQRTKAKELVVVHNSGALYYTGSLEHAQSSLGGAGAISVCISWHRFAQLILLPARTR